MGLEEDLERAASWLARADALGIWLGDGWASVPGSQPPPTLAGLAQSWEPLRKRGWGIGELADPRRFKEDPQLFWEFWLHCCNSYREASPSGTLEPLESLAALAPCGTFLATGSPCGHPTWPSEHLLERCGCVPFALCSEEACGGHTFLIEEGVVSASQLPRCPRCGSLARPALNITGKDPGYSSELATWQIENLWKWLAHVFEDGAALECSSLVVLDLDHGSGVSDFWNLVCGSESCLLISAGVQRADVSPWGGRAVSLPLPGAEALARLEAAQRGLKMASFICKDSHGNGAEVEAPSDSQLGHVLRRSFAALGMRPPKLGSGATLRCSVLQAQRDDKAEAVKLKQQVPKKFIFKAKDLEPPVVRVDVEGAGYVGQNEPLKSRAKAVRTLLEELIFYFDTPMYQRKLALAGDKVAIRDLIREVHLGVLPSHGFPLDAGDLDDVGRARVVVQMQAFLHSGMLTKDMNALGTLLQEVSGYLRMKSLPMRATPAAEKPATAKTAPSLAPAPIPLAGNAGNPLDTNEYYVPPMSQAQVELLTVPFDDIEKRLPEVLEEHGAAIVTGVLESQEELSDLEEEFARDLHDLIDKHAVSVAPVAIQEALKDYAQKGPRAFPARTAEKWLTASAGFGLHRCLCHGRFAWKVRRHPRVLRVFQALFPAASRLVSSMDVTFFSPDGQSAAESNAFSAHVDQNAHDVRPNLSKCDVYQGVLYVWPAGEDGNCSTTVVWPGSHKEVWKSMMQDKAFRLSGARGYHYSEIRAMVDRDKARGLAQRWAQVARRAVVPAGGMLLWSSRTVHAGWKGGPRLAQAVCFEPAARRPEAERMSKLRLAALGLASSHWAAVGMQHDMCIGSPGCLESRSTIADDDGSGDPARMLLPLRKALHPTGLVAEPDRAALWDLVSVDYRHTGMWAPKKDYCELLETSVLAEIKRYL